MKNLTPNSLRFIPAALCLLFSLLANNAKAATSYYWDINGATAGAGGATPTGTWEGNNWNTVSTGIGATAAWVDGGFPRFAAGSDATGSYTVTANSAHTIAGAFLSTGSGTVTIDGAGPLTITAGQQGFFGQSGFLKFTTKLTGTGGVIGSSGQIFLDGNNDYSGGTTPTSLINFNNANSFGTGGLLISSSGGALICEGSSAITIANNWTVSIAATLNCVGNTAGITYSGNIALGAFTLNLGSGGNVANIDIFSGVISGTGGIGRSAAQSPAGIIKLTGANTYTGKSSIQSGITYVSTLNSVTTPAQQTSSSLGKPSSVANGTISIGGTTVGGTLLYTGAGETTDRVIDLAGTTGGATIQNDGTGALTFSSANTASGLGAKTLTLQGSYAGSANTISGAIVNSAVGATAVTKAGAGTWTLSGANTFSGNTTVSVGTLQIGNSSGLGFGGFAFTSTAKTTTVTSGATLDLNGTTGIDAAIILNGTGVGADGALINGNTGAGASLVGQQVASATVTAAGSGITAPATISVTLGGGSGATAAPSLGVTAATFTITAGTQTYTVAPTVTISGGGGSGATATANLSANPGVITTTITVSAPGAGYTSAPTIAFSGGTIGTAGTAPTGVGNATHFSLSGVQITAAGSGYTSAPTLALSTGTGTASAQLCSVNLATTSSIGGPGNITINSVVSGTGGLTKVGAGAVTLTGANTYTGVTTLSGGTLQVDSAETAGTSGPLGKSAAANPGSIVLSGGTLQYSSANNNDYSGRFSTSSSAYNIDVNGQPVTFATPLTSSSAALTLSDTAGGGTLTLSGVNTYTGATTINAGTLDVGASGSIAGNVFNTGGTLELDNTSALASTADLILASSPANGAVILNLSGGTQTINALYFGSTPQAMGTWGASGSGAANISSVFTGNGLLQVGCTGPDQTITPSASAVCVGSAGNTASVTITAGATYSWSITGGTITAGGSSSTATYTAGTGSAVLLSCVVIPSVGCASPGGQNTPVTVDQKSAGPTSATASSSTICNGGSTTLTLNGGGGGANQTIQWYTGSCGGTSAGSGNGLSVSPTATTTYYGRYEDGAPCSYNSACAQVTVTVNQKSADPTSATASVNPTCGGATALTLSGGGGGTSETIHWYTGSCGGTSVGTGNGLSVTPATTTTYYGRYEDGAPCSYNSACQTVTVTVNAKSAAPTSATASVNPLCNGGSTALTLNGGGGGTSETIHWYTGSCGGTSVGTGQALSVSPTATTTYYGRYEDGAPCNFNTTCQTVTVTVRPRPTAVVSGSAATCSGCSTTISAALTGTGPWNVTWSDSTVQSGVATSPATYSVSPSATTTYTVTALTDANCTAQPGDLTGSAVVSLNVAPAISGQPANTTECSGTLATFSVAASGSSLNYSWAVNNNSGWSSPWSVTGSGGTFLDTSTDNDQGPQACNTWSANGDIDSPLHNQALGMWSGGGGGTFATRTFPVLTAGQVASIDFDNGNVDSGGSKVGFSLQPLGGGSDVLQFYFQGGGSDYMFTINDGTPQDTLIGWQYTGLRVQFALTCANTYVLTVTPCGGSPTTFTGTYSGTIAQLQVFNANINGGAQNNVFFNNLIVGGYTDNADNYYGVGFSNGSDQGNQPIALANGSSYTTTPLSANAQYQAVVSGCGGAVLSSVVTATVNPLPTVSVNSQTVCASALPATVTATPAGGTAPYSYAWTVPSGPNPGNVASFSTSVAGTYTVVVTDSSSTLCTGSGSGTLTVNANPTVSVNSQTVCASALPATVTATPAGGTAPYSYAWTVPSGPNPGNVASFSTSVAGTYTVVVTDSSSTLCTGSGSGTLTVNPSPTVSVNSAAICTGGSATITASPAGGTPGYSYAWTVPSGPNPGNVASFSATVAGTYSVVVTDANGCTGGGSGILTVNSAPTADAGSAQTICPGGSGVAIGGSPTATGGTSPYIYLWAPATGLNDATLANPTAIITGTTTYTVTVTDHNGCTATASVVLTAVPQPVLETPTIDILGNVTLVWTSLSGWNYQVQYTTDLTKPINWLPLGSAVPGGSPTTTDIDTSGLGALRFYQVFVVCP